MPAGQEKDMKKSAAELCKEISIAEAARSRLCFTLGGRPAARDSYGPRQGVRHSPVKSRHRPSHKRCQLLVWQRSDSPVLRFVTRSHTSTYCDFAKLPVSVPCQGSSVRRTGGRGNRLIYLGTNGVIRQSFADICEG